MLGPVTKQKQAALAAKMEELGIREEDLEEQFVRASGSGGQKVNKTSTAVRLTHKPSGIEIRCQQSRSQALNRFHARRLLIEKIEADQLGRQSTEQKRIEKIRRQKRKRSKRAKEKVLQDKRQQSQKKSLRRTPSSHDD